MTGANTLRTELPGFLAAGSEYFSDRGAVLTRQGSNP